MPREPLRILDIAYGSGWWCAFLAGHRRKEEGVVDEIIGIDLAPTRLPEDDNLKFRSPYDLNSSVWSVAHESQDLIHASLINGCVQDCLEFYRNIYR